MLANNYEFTLLNSASHYQERVSSSGEACKAKSAQHWDGQTGDRQELLMIISLASNSRNNVFHKLRNLQRQMIRGHDSVELTKIFLNIYLHHLSPAVDQAVACAPVTQRVWVRYPVGASFLCEVFLGFFLTCKTRLGSFRPPRPPNIIWPSLSSFITDTNDLRC